MIDLDKIENIPQELGELPQWGYAIKTDKIQSYKMAAKAVNGGGFDPVGWHKGPYLSLYDLLLHYHTLSDADKDVIGYPTFFMSEDNDYACIDLDPKDNEEHKKHAAELVEICLDTYIERSQSGQGYHIWTSDVKIKQQALQIDGFIDVFTTNGRHIVFTGDMVSLDNTMCAYPSVINTLFDNVKTKDTKKDISVPASLSDHLVSNRGNYTAAEIEQVLHYIDNTQEDNYDRWMHVIFGVAYELKKQDKGYEILSEWSRRGAGATGDWDTKLKDMYYGADTERDDAVTFGTVMYEARQSYGKTESDIQQEINDLAQNKRLTPALRKVRKDELTKAKQVLYGITQPLHDLGDDISAQILRCFPKPDPAHLPDKVTTKSGLASTQPATIPNIKHLLKYAKIDIAYNLLTQEVEFQIEDAPTDINTELNRMSMGAASAYIRSYARQARINSDKSVNDVVNALAEHNWYHPLEELLKNAPAWDGVDRIQDLMDTVPVDDGHKKIWPVYMRKGLYMIMDTILSWREPNQRRGIWVFHSKQGMGKSTWCEQLINIGAGNYYNQLESPRDINGKDSKMQFGRAVITEIPEVDGIMSRQHSSDVKAALTKSFDEYRPPYGQTMMRFPRITTFIATTNVDQFLHDQSGTSRFWVVRCKDEPFDIDALTNMDKLQLWKQVEHEYNELKDNAKPGDRPFWNLTQAEDAIREELNEDAVTEPDWGQRFIDFCSEHNWTPETLAAYPDDQKKAYKITVLIDNMLNNSGGPANTRKPDMVEVAKIITRVTGVERRKNGTITNSWLLPRATDDELGMFPTLYDKTNKPAKGSQDILDLRERLKKRNNYF